MKTKHFILILILIVLTSAGLLLGWLYTGRNSTAKQAVFQKLPLPAAMLNYQPVTAREVYDRIKLAEKILSNVGKSTDEVKQKVYEQLLKNKKLALVAQQHRISVNDSEVEQAYKSNVNKFAGGDEKTFTEQLRSLSGMDPETFKNEAVKQELLLAKLSLWYYQQESLNPEAYRKARELLDKLDSGAKFEEVALAEAGKDNNTFGGDTGFFNFDDLLPEFQTIVKDVAVGSNVLAPSRYGLHVIKVLARSKNEQGQDQMQLQQIYIEGGNFEDWYQKQLDQIKTTLFLKSL